MDKAAIMELMIDKELKAKEKTARLADALLNGEVRFEDIATFAVGAKEPDIANCMEACEYATSRNPRLSGPEMLGFAVRHLSAKAPRLRWEAGKVIGNIAHLYPEDLASAITGLMANAKHDGAVVRWSGAYALTRIAALPKYSEDTGYRGSLRTLYEEEEKNGIRKMYAQALD